MTEESADLLVARWNEQVDGYLLAQRTLTLFAGGPILNLVELFVEATWRSQGIGWALVHTATERAWEAGCVKAVVPTRRASGFYRRLGFEPMAELLKLKCPV